MGTAAFPPPSMRETSPKHSRHRELVMAETLAVAVRIDETGDDGVDAVIVVARIG